MLKADYLFLLTDVDCLYTDNPRTNPNAEPVRVCTDIQALREKGKKKKAALKRFLLDAKRWLFNTQCRSLLEDHRSAQAACPPN